MYNYIPKELYSFKELKASEESILFFYKKRGNKIKIRKRFNKKVEIKERSRE